MNNPPPVGFCFKNDKGRILIRPDRYSAKQFERSEIKMGCPCGSLFFWGFGGYAHNKEDIHAVVVLSCKQQKQKSIVN